ncbi:hypothetical protein M422DRAFT_260318 [Sphaerobolus stellatus SS14]|uniref:MULE transposase domain-containing protein n=1 Tax=Sphaerobolus stellatus (strain SS14) TaxID=990650 RepID=A0A0C9VIL2_SPHS4|nr:hypothetical protein M422DRAFT_260318 [Sphaerobolus stellatus SS14]
MSSNNASGSTFGLDITSIPPAPQSNIFQRGGEIKVQTNLLFLDETQRAAINTAYQDQPPFFQLYNGDVVAQASAQGILKDNGLDIMNLSDLGSRWSIRWSSRNGKGSNPTRRVLLQCMCGSSTKARFKKENVQRKEISETPLSREWKCKMPYDFTGCLAHIDLTYNETESRILRIVGIPSHNEKCARKTTQRLPPIPLHEHVWQIALEQLEQGASITAIQTRNRELCQIKGYQDQSMWNPATANVCYELLPSDSRSLYRQFSQKLSVDITKPPQYNIDDWLDKNSPNYKPEIAAAVFYYRARVAEDTHLRVCIQTEEMKNAAWKYSHQNQLILDGTFGVCDRRVLLFIALGVDENNKGVPLAFFLFSALAGNRATHAGYDTNILHELLTEWRDSRGKKNGTVFTPLVAITDAGTKERGALTLTWPSIWLILCKFHVRQCWSNHRKKALKIGRSQDFPKLQIQSRICAVEEQ